MNKLEKYVSKPVVIEATKFTDSYEDIDYLKSKGCPLFLKQIQVGETDHGGIFSERTVITTLEGDMTVSEGDWIIKGTIGEWYPCKDEVFKKKYEGVSE